VTNTQQWQTHFARSADFLVCRIAGFQPAGRTKAERAGLFWARAYDERSAGWKTGGTAGWKACATYWRKADFSLVRRQTNLTNRSEFI
jgi:hypothetical protein